MRPPRHGLVEIRHTNPRDAGWTMSDVLVELDKHLAATSPSEFWRLSAMLGPTDIGRCYTHELTKEFVEALRKGPQDSRSALLILTDAGFKTEGSSAGEVRLRFDVGTKGVIDVRLTEAEKNISVHYSPLRSRFFHNILSLDEVGRTYKGESFSHFLPLDRPADVAATFLVERLLPLIAEKPFRWAPNEKRR